MSNQAVVKREERAVEYIPFGSDQKIRLTEAIVIANLCVPTKSGRRCSPAEARKFIMLCQGKGLNPWEGDAYLVGYDARDQAGNINPVFSLITAHQVLLKRAEVHPEYVGMTSGVVIRTDDGLQERETCFVEDGEVVVGGWAKVHRKTKDQSYSKLAVSQRKPKYATQFWEGAKIAEQIQKCAEADALRMAFPTKIGGLYMSGEMSFPINVDARVSPGDDSTLKLVDVQSVSVATPEAAQMEAGMHDPQSGEPAPEPEEQNERRDPPPRAQRQQQPKPAANEVQANSSKDELIRLVTTEGFNFGQFQHWAVTEGVMPAADSMAQWEDVPEAEAKRLLRAKAGLIAGLKRTANINSEGTAGNE